LHVRNQNRRRRNWCLVSGASSIIVGQPSRDGSDGTFTFELSFFMWAVWPSYAYEGKGCSCLRAGPAIDRSNCVHAALSCRDGRWQRPLFSVDAFPFRMDD
jgi:hypothetical protein